MNPSGRQIEISGGGYTAVVVEGGGGLRTLTRDGIPIVSGYDASAVPSGGRGQVLVPWPNRIRDGAYEFDGSKQQLGLSEAARHNASHGLVRWCSWPVASVSDDAVTMAYRLSAQSGYPWALDLRSTYTVGPEGLSVTLAATSLATTTAPFAAGLHPYLDTGSPADVTTLTLPAGTRQLVDDRMLPTGLEPVAGAHDFRRPRAIGDLALDDAFTDLGRDAGGLAVVRLAGAHDVELWMDRAWRWVQVYTGDALGDDARRSIAVEPMTSPADAFNSGVDLIRLEPGQTWSGTFGIR